MDEQLLLRRLRLDDVKAYEDLINTYSQYVYAICLRVSGKRLSTEDIEEITADVFIKIWTNRHTLKLEAGKLKAYLAMMARNKTLNRIRTVENKPVVPLEEDCIHYVTPESEVEARELGESLNQWINALPEPEKTLFIRRYFYVEKLEEISRSLEIPLGTVGTKLSRTRKKLEQWLKERSE